MFSASQMNSATRARAEQERHPAIFEVWAKADDGGPVEQSCGSEQAEANIHDEVMSEEVDVDGERQNRLRPERREPDEVEIEQTPHPGDIASDTGIHEPGEERHVHDLQQGRFGVDPASDLRLEQFHHRPDQMEDEDHLRLLPCLQPENDHADLDGDGAEGDEIISGERDVVRVEQKRREQQGQHQSTEQAGPSLLDSEADKFEQALRPGPAHKPVPEPIAAVLQRFER